MTPVFLDTVGLIAIWDALDQWHQQAYPVYIDLLMKKRPMVTTPLVLLESANAASRKPYRKAVCDLRYVLTVRNLLIEPTEQEIHQSWKDYETGPIGGPGIVDLISFAAMKRHAISEALTNDRHFSAAGFITLF